MASGGIVTGPTLAMVGERGPEAVIPLNKGMQRPIIVNIDVHGSVHDEISLERAVTTAVNTAARKNRLEIA